MNQNRKIRLAIVDDHQIVIDGLVSVLQQHEALQIVVTANSGNEMLQLLQENEVDILLSDIMMDGMNGQQLSKAVKEQFPQIKIIALSMNNSGEIVDNMINDANIVGYLLKQTSKVELVEAIIKVYNGGQYFQDKILIELEKESKRKKILKDAHLTLREKQILALMEKDFSNKEIAAELSISILTVETHRKNIFRKTNTNNVLTLVKWAYENKILG